MTITIDEILTALAAFEENIAGVTRTFAKLPQKINRADMPLFINLVNAAAYDWTVRGAGMYEVARTYLPRLYIMPVGSGVEYEAQNLAAPVIDSYIIVMGQAAKGKLGLDSVTKANLLGDTGIQVLGYMGDEFIGVEFSIEITTLEQIAC